jgi:hypothetical protein
VGDLAIDLGLRLVRVGGNRFSAYNWENNASNAGSDYQFQNDDFVSASDVPGIAMEGSLATADTGLIATLVTGQLGDYVAADKEGGGDVTTTADYLTTRFKKNVLTKSSGLDHAGLRSRGGQDPESGLRPDGRPLPRRHLRDRRQGRHDAGHGDLLRRPDRGRFGELARGLGFILAEDHAAAEVLERRRHDFCAGCRHSCRGSAYRLRSIRGRYSIGTPFFSQAALTAARLLSSRCEAASRAALPLRRAHDEVPITS